MFKASQQLQNGEHLWHQRKMHSLVISSTVSWASYCDTEKKQNNRFNGS